MLVGCHRSGTQGLYGVLLELINKVISSCRIVRSRTIPARAGAAGERSETVIAVAILINIW
jgi:hypothetical protein